MNKKKVSLIIEIVLFVCALFAITGIYYFGGNDTKIEEEAGEVGIVKVDDDNFQEEVLSSDKPVILEFSSNNCPPCLTMIPTMINIAKNNKNIKVASVNCDDDNVSKIVKDYHIDAYPTIFIIKEGQIQKRFVGVTSETALLSEAQ